MLIMMSKKIIVILALVVICIACEKEEEPSLKKSSTSAGNTQDTSSLITNRDTSIVTINKDTLYWGTYKGVAVNGKDNSCALLIHIASDTSGSCSVIINNELFVLSFDTSLLVGTNRIVEYVAENISLSITTTKDGIHPKVSINFNNIAFEVYIMKEKATEKVNVYTGNWVATVKTPINSFEEKGIWCVVHNNKTILGSNGEGPVIGTISSSGIYSGTHNNGTFTGSKTNSTLDGTFTWSAFGLSGIGDWQSQQVNF